MSASWEQRWRDLLEEGAPAARPVALGRAWQRSGRVADLRVGTGRVRARVQGTRATPYAIEIAAPVMTDGDWQRVAEVAAAELRHGARLLAGLAPAGLEDELEAEGIALFGDLSTYALHCECQEPVRPCVHLAAAWEGVALGIAEDPFLLFRLRGRGRERLLEEIARARGSVPAPSAVEDPRRRDPARWSRADASLEEVSVPAPAAPVVPAAPLRVLGDPPGWGGSVSAWDLFRPLVEAAASWARPEEASHEGEPGTGDA